jgi:hypothetical protein
MSSTKLTSAATVAAALLALAPAGALAAKHHHKHAINHAVAPHGCRVTLHVEKHVLTSGESALAYGIGSCGKAPSSGQPVTLYERPAGASGFSTAGTGTTDSGGGYQIPTGTLTYNTAFYAVIGTAHSVERQVKVAAQVELVGPSEGKTLLTALKTGRPHAVTFTGSVDPKDAGAVVVLQRQNSIRGIGWATISRGTLVDQNGNFSITHAFVVPGASNIRVVMKLNRHNITSPSNELSFTISQAQNPSLTIESAQDPVPFGGSTSIGGTAAGLANTAVTLLARTHGGKFAPVATTTTDGSGKYSFATVKPPASTLYRVQSGGRSSAVLYEGVKYVLTAVTPASVQSGQPLTVTGTVAPIKPGHPVLLQKKNAVGPGWHTVSQSTVQADGTYTLAETFFVPGSYTLRVKVPGDPENGASASPVFTTTVTPVPAASIPAAGTP